MTTHLELEALLDRPSVAALASDELSLLVTVRPGAGLRDLRGGVRVGTNVCLLIDVSQSMEEHGKLPAAIAAASELVQLSDPAGMISVVAFDEEAYVLAEPTPVSRRADLLSRLPDLQKVGGGTTNITVGLTEATRQVMSVPDEGRAKVIILLSDGEDNTCKPDVIGAAVKAADADIQLFAVGMGDAYEADFLKALVAPGGGSLFGHAEVARVKEAFIDLAVTLSNVVATQVMLELEFAQGVLAGKTYKASPDQIFLGNVRLGPSRRHTRRIGNVERNKEYQLLFRVRVPTEANGKLPVATARLRYDVPGLREEGCEASATVDILVGEDPRRPGRPNGAVLECYRRVQLTELVERFVEAHRAGRPEDTARYLDLLISNYGDVNDRAMVNHYEAIRRDLLAGGKITRSMINQSVVASTVVRGGGEIPALLDDSF
jgi:hypothetical protein